MEPTIHFDSFNTILFKHLYDFIFNPLFDFVDLITKFLVLSSHICLNLCPTYNGAS